MLNLIDDKFRKHLWKYILQCLAATLSIVVILNFLDVLTTTAIIASLGATTFIAFTMPRSYPAYMRPMLGGYLVGIGSGVLCNWLANLDIMVNIMRTPKMSIIVFAGIAVGLAIFTMSITNTEHAPASGVALGLVVNKWDIWTIIFILSAVLFLTFIRILLRPVMIDVRQLEKEHEEKKKEYKNLIKSEHW